MGIKTFKNCSVKPSDSYVLFENKPNSITSIDVGGVFLERHLFQTSKYS